MTDYSMPVLSEQERKIIMDTCAHMISRSDTSEYSANFRVVAQIALAALTATPVVHEAEINGVMSSVTKSHFADCERHGVKTRKLYSAPTVPVKQEGEQ